MSFLRQLAEVSFEETSIITFGEQLRRSEGLTSPNTTTTAAVKKPSFTSSPVQESLVADGESTQPESSHEYALPLCRAPNACFDCCTGILFFLAVLPLVSFIPAIVLQRVSTSPTIVGGGNSVDGLSTNGYGFEVDGNWVAALSPTIVLLVLATIALTRVCCCAVCCGASGTRSDTDDYIASLGGDVIRVPAAVRVFPAFNTLREHLRKNGNADEKQENREGESSPTTVLPTTKKLLSESDVATVAWDALLVDGGNSGTLDANKARRKMIAIIWMLTIVQFIVLCVRLNDSESGQIEGIQAAVGEVISSAVTGSGNSTAERITAQRLQCGTSVLSSAITSNSTGGKSGASLVDEAAVNGLVAVPYPDRSWTATFIPTMLILLLIILDQLVLVEAAHIARIDFTKEETAVDDESTTSPPTGSQKREQRQQQANKSSMLLSHAPILVRLVDVVAVVLSFALFLCRMDGTYPFDCSGASALTSTPWLTVLLPVIISLLLDCFVSLSRGAWLSYSISGSFSLVAGDVTQPPSSSQLPTSLQAETQSLLQLLLLPSTSPSLPV